MAAPPPGAMPPPAPGYYAPPPPMPMPPSRPLGVTILAVLTILFGIGLFLLGLLVAVVGALLSPIAGGIALIALVGGVLFLLVGIMMIAAGSGLLRLRMWAWWLAIIAFALGTVSSILSASWFTAVILVLLIVYLVLVRKHFGQPRPMGM